MPEQGRADRLPGGVERDHAVLLPGHGERGHPVEQPGARLLEGPPPHLGVDLGRVGMRCLPGPQHRTGIRVTDDDPGRLGTQVDPGHQTGHVRIVATAVASWVIISSA
jgi:hypothetical protein